MANEILDLLEEINSMNTTVVMVTHEPDLAIRAHRRLHLLDGRLIDLEEEDRPTPLVGATEPAVIARS
jgi:ABC-type lipoprotein export system ATPase subunit